jgi:NADH-quinone oxidoreductase subunit M
MVGIGVYPKPILERIEPSVDRLVAHVEDQTDFEQPEVATAVEGGAR